ncbi:MAG: hypothetical protein GC164_09975 [Phycisphaera sp.]|nr:hypothetical protein [Phycisphaera sp.]
MSTCTNQVLLIRGRADRWRDQPNAVWPRSRFRGVAEIELLFCLGVMLTLFFIVWGSMRVNTARQRVQSKAQLESRQKATGLSGSWSLPSLSGGSLIVPNGYAGAPASIPSTRSFPNRAYTSEPSETVRVYVGSGVEQARGGWMPPVTVGTHAGLVGPAWTWSGAYQPLDRQPIRNWYKNLRDFAVKSKERSGLKMKDD